MHSKGQPGLQRVFQDSQVSPEQPCLKKPEKNTIHRMYLLHVSLIIALCGSITVSELGFVGVAGQKLYYHSDILKIGEVSVLDDEAVAHVA